MFRFRAIGIFPDFKVKSICSRSNCMKKFLAICALAFTVSVQAQNAGDQGQPQGQGQQGAGQKTIKDAAEYNAYVSATGMSDPGQKAAALEQFVQQYPNSIVKEDALQ